MQMYTIETRQRAVEYFEQALALDPSFAPAHAELSITCRRLSGGGIWSPEDAMLFAEQHAMRPLDLDKDLAIGHAAIADVKKDKWDFDGALREYKRALELSPTLQTAPNPTSEAPLR